MSSSQVVDWVGNGKIYTDLLPNPYPFPAQANPLSQVLIAGQDAGNQDIINLNEIQVTNVTQQVAPGILNPHLSIGGPGNTLRVLGATDKGSIIVGDGTDTKELVCPTTTNNIETTGTIYNWLSIANGQSRTFNVSNGSLYAQGYSITITYNGTDSITGTITAVVGDDVTITITSFTNAAPSISNLILTTTPNGAVAGNPTDPIFGLNPATTTPTPPELPPNSMIIGGQCFLYSILGDPNPTPFTISILGTNIQRPTSNTQNTPLWENPTITSTIYAFPDGCFTSTPQIVQIQANTGGAAVAFGFPAGGSFVNQDYCGFLTGYTLPYSSGTIGINSKLVLTADNTKPLGVFWGVDAQGVGTITSVSGGNNISISGSLSAPVVNFQSPTTSNIVLGVGTEILATSGNTTMSIDSTGLTDTFLSGPVENKEDIAVTATSVQNTISTTSTGDYQNSAVVTSDTNFVNNVMSSQILTAGFEKTASASITCNTSSTFPIAQFNCGVSAPTTSPFPDITASVAIGCSDTTNGFLQISQSAPFAPTFITTLDKNGLVQNNSSGAGFNLQCAQDITLTCPSANKIIVPNGNDIDLSSTTGSVVHTTTYGKDGMESQDFLAGTYASQANLTQSSGASQMFISSSNLTASSNQYLRCEATAGGDLNIEHNGTAGRNLAITTNQSLSITAPNQPISVSTGSFQTFSSARTGGVTQPSFVFENPNATSGSFPVVRTNKSLGNLAAGDAVSAISSWGRDASGVSREWTRIQTNAENVTTSPANQDGTLSFWGSINGVVAQVANFNGAQNENNMFRPLDMNGNAIRTTLGSMTIDTSPSSTAGAVLTLATKDNVAGSGAGLALTGNTLLSASAGGNSGQHLCLTIGGVVYKIALLNP
jgi:hypothetical protein